MSDTPVLRPAEGRQVTGGCALAMMIKAPRAGASKTRLAPPLTLEEAAGMSRCFLADTAENIGLAAEHLPAQGVAVYTPVGLEAAFEGLFPAGFILVPQSEGTFGERLLAATEDLLTLGFAAVCLIDSDSPTLPTEYLREAVQALAAPGDRLVLGPSDDGGYYLVGLKKAHARPFQEITWSTEKVTPQTLERAGEIGLPVHQLPAWYDVDDGPTLNRLCGELFGEKRQAGFPAPRTRALLRELLAENRDLWPSATPNRL